MYKIIVRGTGVVCLGGHWSHISVKIEDLDSKDSKNVFTVSWDKNRAYAGFYGRLESKLTEKVSITLYSNIDKSLDDFQKKLKRNFDNDAGFCDDDLDTPFPFFNVFTKNCADAGIFTLRYFFPVINNNKFEEKRQLFKALKFPFCLATLGCTPFFECPPLFNGPVDVIKIAHYLSRTYNNIDKASLLPQSQTMV